MNNKNNLRIWQGIAGIFLVLLLGSFFFGGKSGEIISEKEAGKIILDFTNSRVEGNVDLVEVNKLEGLYEVIIKYQGNDIPLYLTQDGKNLVQGITPINELPKTGTPSATTTSTTKNQEINVDEDKIDDVVNTPLRKPQDELLDKFIITQPRIVAQKSEFYSPGNMARKSAIEHEDLISETLARIYAQQGYIPKAIDAYKRLSLKSPEKSSYFAALIKELEEKED